MITSVESVSCSGESFMSSGVAGRFLLTGRMVSLPLYSNTAVWMSARLK